MVLRPGFILESLSPRIWPAPSKLRQVCKLRQRLILYILLFMMALNKPWVVASASLIRNLFYSIKDSQIYCDS